MPRRGSTDQRGYGVAHRKLRAKWRPLVEAGGVTCARCGQPIQPRDAWDLGHIDGSNRTMYQGPEHAHCNRRAGQASRQATDPAPRPRTRW